MRPLPALTAAAGGAHAADQLALAALPLTATLALGAGPGVLGLLVAAHAAAWLVVSLPAGVAVDRLSRRSLSIAAQALTALAFLAATAAAAAGWTVALGATAFVGAAGAVVFVLAAHSAIADLVQRSGLAAANARLELARGVMALGAPALVGLLAAHATPTAGYALAAAAALVAALCLAQLPAMPPPDTAGRPSPLEAIRDGAAFVARQDLLRAIGLCAVFWNFAFFALAAVFVPFALQRVALEAAGIGLAQAAYGAGALLAALTAGRLVGRAEPRWTLMFGPGVSVVAAGLIAAAPHLPGALPGVALPTAFMPLAAGYFLIGFGPVLWLICQTTVRQMVTPSDLLGRVGATIQVAIYGVRPLGALAGGAIAAQAGLDAAMLAVMACFAASFAVVLLSPLARLRAMPASPAAAAA